MTRKNIFLILSAFVLFVPTAIHLVNYMNLKNNRQHEIVFRLPAIGYDPRDIIHGRYAMLQIDWKLGAVDPECAPLSESTPLMTLPASCGICLKRMNAASTHVSLRSANKDCQKFLPLLPGSNRTSPFVINDAPATKFFLDERIANRVDEALRGRSHQFSVDAIFAGKKVIFNELYIDNIPHRQFIEYQQNTKN